MAEALKRKFGIKDSISCNTSRKYSLDMVADNLISAYPTHPGSILKDEIEYRGISQRKLAKDMV